MNCGIPHNRQLPSDHSGGYKKSRNWNMMRRKASQRWLRQLGPLREDVPSALVLPEITQGYIGKQALASDYMKVKAKAPVMSFILMLILTVSNSALAAGIKPPENESAPIIGIVERPSEYRQDDIDIKIQNDGEKIIVDASFTVPVTPHHAWAVLTDFDNTPSFMSSIQSSKITHKAGNHLQVSQKGATKYGVFTFSFESVREISLSPFKKIRERMISGNMRAMEETTQLLPEGNQTRIIYHANIIPNTWILKFAGQIFIENEARKQFQEIINEVIRRKQRIISSR
jgi:carbon monoxide dehydrogenase subunit G